MQKTNVLIIGAGPTGLMAACQLRRHGIEFLIIDKKEGPTIESRALVIHARSLEIYEQMGIAAAALDKGEILQTAQFIIKGKKIRKLAFGNIGEGLSPFPFLLVLEQSKNEELLYKFLQQNNGDVLWNTEMTFIQTEKKNVLVTINHNGQKQVIETDYVIAADGGKSAVRNLLKIPFKGGTYEHTFYVADTKLEWQWGHDALSMYLTKKTMLGLFPMKGENRFRAIGILPADFKFNDPEKFDDIVPIIQQQVGIPLKFSDTKWFSLYRLHHRCIQHFRKDRIFFAGDAAHIHSPAGGQGMNTGLQDAYNLAWKLAFVINGNALDRILNTYEQERLPLAKKLLASTDRGFSVATSHKWYYRFFRLHMLPFFSSVMLKSQFFRLQAFKNVSQIAIKYISSDLTMNRLAQTLAIKAGERFPYLLMNNDNSVYKAMLEPVFHALIFNIDKKNNLVSEFEMMQKQYRKVISVIDMSSEKKIQQKLKIKKDTVILVRPDHYIGLITDEKIKVVWDYLEEIGLSNITNSEEIKDL